MPSSILIVLHILKHVFKYFDSSRHTKTCRQVSENQLCPEFNTFINLDIESKEYFVSYPTSYRVSTSYMVSTSYRVSTLQGVPKTRKLNADLIFLKDE